MTATVPIYYLKSDIQSRNERARLVQLHRWSAGCSDLQRISWRIDLSIFQLCRMVARWSFQWPHLFFERHPVLLEALDLSSSPDLANEIGGEHAREFHKVSRKMYIATIPQNLENYIPKMPIISSPTIAASIFGSQTLVNMSEVSYTIEKTFRIGKTLI